MRYHLGRNGAVLGPFSVEEIHLMVARREAFPSDLCWTHGMPNWAPVGQVLLGYPRPTPPDLHWGLLLIFSFFAGAFMLAWAMVQANFVKQIDPASRAMRLYTINLILMPIMGVVMFVAAIAGSATRSVIFFATFLLLLIAYLIASSILYLKATYNMRRSLLAYYNSIENYGLRLGPVMTFFFGPLYFQYHFNRINRWQMDGLLH
ncbi:MAG: DUF4339 domain-containing protein [Acidobacteria bacterium]|nr:DUF4339 domain-containing protein [Acidobacteriota bacterium]